MTPDDDGFAPLWPTLFLQRVLPGHEAANAALLGLIEALDAQHDDLTTGYRDGNLFNHEHPALGWLQQCIGKSATDYLRRQGVDYPVDMTLHGWANVNRLGDYHDVHNHPHSYLSGTYYVAMPAQPARQTGRGDLNPGAISFYDPRPQANMNAIRDDAQIDPQITLMPEPGTILLWPAFVHHFVHPNLADALRVSVSFNIVLRGVERYLPS